MPSGKIKFYASDRGFGFIEPDDNSADKFFHVSQVGGAAVDLQPGMRVKFEDGFHNHSGRPEAKNVTVLL